MNKRFITLLFLVIFTVSCSDDKEDIKIEPIELNKRVAKIDHINTSDYIDILKGNGKYKIEVKEFSIDKEYEKIPFENHTTIKIEGNKILATRILKEDFTMIAVCVLTDSLGIKKTFVVENPGLLGIHDFYD